MGGLRVENASRSSPLLSSLRSATNNRRGVRCQGSRFFFFPPAFDNGNVTWWREGLHRMTDAAQCTAVVKRYRQSSVARPLGSWEPARPGETRSCQVRHQIEAGPARTGRAMHAASRPAYGPGGPVV